MRRGARYPEICLVRRGSAQARRALDEHGYDRFYYVEAKVPADARRITLAEQDEKWLSRKVDILAVHKVWEAAERQYEEVSKQSRATLRAYCAKPPEASEADLRQANEAFDQAINARDEAWDRCNQYTLGETERAKNSMTSEDPKLYPRGSSSWSNAAQ
jgi:hypothetical protein